MLHVPNQVVRRTNDIAFGGLDAQGFPATYLPVFLHFPSLVRPQAAPQVGSHGRRPYRQDDFDGISLSSSSCFSVLTDG
jgi:hypothetical protein